MVHGNKRTNGDGRALVHKAVRHNVDDECWIIMLVKEKGVYLGYTVMKSQVFFLFGFAHNFEISKYLCSITVLDNHLNSYYRSSVQGQPITYHRYRMK